MKITNYKKCITILFMLLACYTNILAQTINENWEFKQVNKFKWHPASVPGSIHTDLLNNHLIEDPFFRDNEKKVQWIENEDWEYKTQFNVDKNVLAKDEVALVFKGLDTYAWVYLNDSLILSADNMYRSWKVNCKSLLKNKNNVIRILFKSAVKEGLKKVAKNSYLLPNHNEKTVESRKSSSQTRKSPYQYGWDTHPRLVTCGIWRPIVIESYNKAKIIDYFAKAISINKNLARYNLQYTINSYTTNKCLVSVYLNNVKTPISKQYVDLKKGINNHDIAFSIKNPKLWWPNGMGKANLYQLKIVLSHNDNLISEKSSQIGVRTIEVVREKDSIGKSFYFKVNGIPLFVKGSNYKPQDFFVNRIKKSQIKTVIDDACAANMNLLRVWGGAIYEDDYFYDLCAQKGLLVWQDFMYSCSMYPGDTEFLENIKQETIENVKHLRNNPSLALLCGNNELITGWFGWHWPSKPELKISKTDSVKILNDYNKIFNDVIPNVIKEFSPQTFYWPSSPGSNEGEMESLKSGDYHYYGVWYVTQSLHNYKWKIPRFMSEYGVQSLPSYATFKKYFIKEDENLFSPMMMYRQRSVMPWIEPDMEGNKMLMRYLDEDYNKAKNFESLIYISQLFQADAIKIATEAHRIHKPICMGTMFWEYNEAWPNIGWSIVDYLGNKKAAYYIVKKLFKNVSVIPTLTDSIITPKTTVNVFVNSDSLNATNAELKITVQDFNGKIYKQITKNVSIEAMSNKIFYSNSVGDLIDQKSKNEVCLVSQLSTQGKIISNNILYFNHPKYLDFQKPKIKVFVEQVGANYRVKLYSNTLAKSVRLALPEKEIKNEFSDNFVDLLPNHTYVIRLKSKLSLKEIQNNLQVQSLYDWQENTSGQ